MKMYLLSTLSVFGAFALSTAAASLTVPSFSFEAPEVPNTVPALPFFEAWQRTPKPDWYQEDPNEPQSHWANLAGVFPNPEAGQAGSIANTHLKQAAYLFAVPGNGIFQELPATYALAQSYTLTVGLVGSATIPPQEGSTLSISFYYRDNAGRMIPINPRTIVYNAENFPDVATFRDFPVTTPAARALDPWLGRNIGLAITAFPAGDNAGGIWDIDNVRVESGPVNASFETPPVPNTVPALPMIFAPGWTQTPKPDWYQETPNEPQSQWANLAGIFPNSAPGTDSHITNLDGNQAAYLFAVPSNGIFQTLPALYEPGVSYQMTAAFVGSSTFPPPDGTTLEMALFYMNGAERVNISSTPVVYNPSNFPSLASTVDFSVATPFLGQDHPAIGKNVGLSIISTVATAGGIWDLENVRFSAEALRVRSQKVGNSLRITWASKSGTIYRLQTSSDLVNWSDTDDPVGISNGELSVDVPIDSAARAVFYKLSLVTAPTVP
jgi:hypothetical protein